MSTDMTESPQWQSEDVAAMHSDTVKVLQITDLHLLADPDDDLLGINTEKTFQAVINLAKSLCWPPDLALVTGDLAQEYTQAAYSRLYNSLSELELPCFCLPGNHDEAVFAAETLNAGKIRYLNDVLVGNWQIICLDTKIPNAAGGGLSARELEKLQARLQQHQDRHVLVALHHPPVEVGSRWLDTMVLNNADELFAILRQHTNIRGILCGHIHQELDIEINGIRVLGSPSTCFQFKPNSEEFEIDSKAGGFRWLELRGDGRIVTEVYRLEELPKGLDLGSPGY